MTEPLTLKQKLSGAVEEFLDSSAIPRDFRPIMGVVGRVARHAIKNAEEEQLRQSLTKLRDDILPRLFAFLLDDQGG